MCPCIYLSSHASNPKTHEQDFQGQKLSELMYQVIILLAAVVSFVIGYATSSFRTMMLIYGGGVVLAFVIAVPDWPYFNQHPQRWLAVDADHPDWSAQSAGGGGGAKQKGGSAGNSNNRSGKGKATGKKK